MENNERVNECMRANKRADGLYDIYTKAGFIGTVMESQLEKAEQILKRDMWGRRFYTLLND